MPPARRSALTDGGMLLADLTTLRVGGPAGTYVPAATEQDLVEAVSDCDGQGEPVLLLGGGSNLLVSDAGFPGTVVHIRTRGIDVVSEGDGHVDVEAAAGENWDDFVALSTSRGWSGLEALSGIPGLVGATPVQNVGAYGSEVAAAIVAVRVWDRIAGSVSVMAPRECGFGYRTSVFKQDPGRRVVLSVTFRLRTAATGSGVAYPELARRLGVELGDAAAAADVREAVLAIRTAKGMVLDAADHDTWSAGSFFTNPILTAEQAGALPVEAPRWPAGDLVKTSAAWLIQAAGFDRGYGNERVRLSHKHVLALTNRGTASAADLVELATKVRDGVREQFGVELTPEVNLVGTSLQSP